MQGGPSRSEESHGEAFADDWPFPALALAGSLVEKLLEPSALREVAMRFAEVAKAYGCQSVLGASAIGSNIAGAIVALSDGSISLFSPVNAGRGVLIVDGVIITGTQIAKSMRIARDAGADKMVGVGVYAYKDALSTWGFDNGQGRVLALEEISP